MLLQHPLEMSGLEGAEQKKIKIKRVCIQTRVLVLQYYFTNK
jgi:hypothetical protein